MRLKIFSIQAILGLLFVSLFFVALISPILAQDTANTSSTIRDYIPDTPSQSAICGIADGRQATIISNGSCNSEYLTGICANVIDFTSKALSGYTWVNGACTVQVEGIAGLIKLRQESQKGILASIERANAFLLDQRPLSTKNFFEQKIYAIQNFGKVTAQEVNPLYYYPGTGFSLLEPIQSFWGWSVNIVYGLLIFIIIGVALSIVFRSSLNGQAIVTIQNAIPNIAMAMILVPLSYAISGLFIDAITVGTNVVHQFLVGPGSPGYDVFLSRNEDFGDRRFGTPAYDSGFYDRGLYADDDRVNWINARNGLEIQSEVDGLINFISNTASSGGFHLISGIAGVFGYNGSSNGWIGAVVNFIVSIILLLTGLRIFWKLIQKWVLIVVTPIFSPFIFATIAIPGNGTNAIMNYIKTMGSFSAAYIVAYAMILLSMVLSSRAFQASIPDFATTGYVPPLLGLDLFSTGAPTSAAAASPAAVDTNLTGFYLSLGALVIYLLIPKALGAVDKQLGAEGLPIMSFLTDAVTSAKDSINLGKNIVNLPKNISSVRTKAFQATMNALDRARGIRPGEEGSYLARRRARLSSRLAELEQKRQSAVESGNWAAARYYQTRVNQLTRTIGDTDGASGGDGKKTEGPNAIEIKVAFLGSDGGIDINSIIGQLEARRGAPGPIVIPGGKLIIASKQKFYPDRNIPRSRLAGVNVGVTPNKFIPFTDIILEGFPNPVASNPNPLDMSDIYSLPRPLFSNSPVGSAQPETYQVQVLSPANEFAEIGPDGKTAEVKLGFVVFNVAAFLAGVDRGLVNKSKFPEEIRIRIRGHVFGQLDLPRVSSRGIESNKLGFLVKTTMVNNVPRSY